MSRSKPWTPVWTKENPYTPHNTVCTEIREAFRPSFILNQEQRSRTSSMDSNLRPIRPKIERKSIICENCMHRQDQGSHLSSRSSSEESNSSRNRSKLKRSPKVYQNRDVRPKITSNLTNNFKNEPNPSLFQNMGTSQFENTVPKQNLNLRFTPTILHKSNLTKSTFFIGVILYDLLPHTSKE